MKQSVCGGNNARCIFVLFYTIYFFFVSNKLKKKLSKDNRKRDYTLNIIARHLCSIYCYHYRKIRRHDHTNIIKTGWCVLQYIGYVGYLWWWKNGIYSSFFMCMNVKDVTVKITMAISNIMPRLFWMSLITEIKTFS